MPYHHAIAKDGMVTNRLSWDYLLPHFRGVFFLACKNYGKLYDLTIEP